jgi:hypothetical protein
MKPTKSVLLYILVFGAPPGSHWSNSEAAKLKRKRLLSILLPTLALCLCSLQAMAGVVVFSDLGPPCDVYDSTGGSLVAESSIIAEEFFVEGVGSVPVVQVDLAVGYVLSSDSFNAAIYTATSNGAIDVPGAPVASWDDLATNTAVNTCCALISQTVTNVDLTADQSYFMVLGPVSSGNTFDEWFDNSQGVDGLVLTSNDGGNTWTARADTLPAFDVLSAPEPGSLFLFGAGLIAILCVRRRRSNCDGRQM